MGKKVALSLALSVFPYMVITGLSLNVVFKDSSDYDDLGDSHIRIF